MPVVYFGSHTFTMAWQGGLVKWGDSAHSTTILGFPHNLCVWSQEVASERGSDP